MKNLKNKIAACFLMLTAVLATQAQEQKASPAAKAEGKISNRAEVIVNYSSPAVKGREIWGGLVPFGKIWRAGANEATTLETTEDLVVEGKKLPAGKYSVFMIPNKDEATVIFNKVWKQSGTREYKESEDALRVSVKPVMSKERSERLVYSFPDTGDALHVIWDHWIIPIKVQ